VNNLIGTAFRDVFGNLMLYFIVMYILLPHQPQPELPKQKAEVESQGQLIVEATWPPGMNVDIDTWVQHPMGANAVGWSNPGDINCNLLRDDLGARPTIDPVQENREQIQCRKYVEGEYRVNLNYYRGVEYNVPVKVVVRLWTNVPGGAGGMTTIYDGTVQMRAEGFEDTLIHWYVDSAGSIIAKDKDFKSVRTSGASAGDTDGDGGRRP
jgi:hypothetical protein